LRRELAGTGLRVMLALTGWPPSNASLRSDARYRQGRIEDPAAIADGIVEGLVQGAEEFIPGGVITRVALFLDKYLPGLSHLYSLLVDEARAANET
jgi:hypothetical protein